MNDYFVWKNESSEYNNIIVTKLPAITKPPIRSEIVEIDGKDGDITNVLGYSSYIRTLGIAFKSNSDVYMSNNELDYISNWLTGESEIVFSNEPDKYYKGIILNQIDYEKALRYRMADINIKVQPYKYSKENKVMNTTSFKLYNQSYLDVLPVITLTGSGLIHLIINDAEVCQINIDDRITIDSVLQEAYKDNINNLANRNMLGDFPVFKSGENTVSWFGTGSITQIESAYRLRWL